MHFHKCGYIGEHYSNIYMIYKCCLYIYILFFLSKIYLCAGKDDSRKIGRRDERRRAHRRALNTNIYICA